MPSYTRGSNTLIAETRGKSREGLFRPNQRRRPAMFVDNAQNEAFAGQMDDPNRKLIYGSTDDRGRVKSEYFTDNKGRLKIPYGHMHENTDPGSGATVITMTTANAYYPWITAEDNGTYGDPYMTFENDDTNGDKLVVGQEGAGIWAGQFSICAHPGSPAGFTLETEVFVNGVESEDFETWQYMSTAGKFQNISITGLAAFEAGDYIQVKFASDVASRAIDLHMCSVTMFRINHKR